jgi:putative transposase
MGFDYRSWHVYHLTWGTIGRKPVLVARGLVIPLIDELKREVSDEEMLLYAYCFMPDHVHILLAPEGGRDVVSFVRIYKSKTTRIYWGLGNQGRLWQHGFYDRILRQEEHVKQVAGYIMENPVQKGLVKDFREYPFSGSLVFNKDDLS